MEMPRRKSLHWLQGGIHKGFGFDGQNFVVIIFFPPNSALVIEDCPHFAHFLNQCELFESCVEPLHSCICSALVLCPVHGPGPGCVTPPPSTVVAPPRMLSTQPRSNLSVGVNSVDTVQHPTLEKVARGSMGICHLLWFVWLMCCEDLLKSMVQHSYNIPPGKAPFKLRFHLCSFDPITLPWPCVFFQIIFLKKIFKLHFLYIFIYWKKYFPHGGAKPFL